MREWIPRAAAQFPTPFYLFDIDGISPKLREMESAWRRYFPRFTIAYSYKTNSTKSVAREIRRLGVAAEVVSGTELAWALEDGFKGTQLFFNGPCKTPEELRLALGHGVRVHVDSLEEIATLGNLGAKVPIGLRLEGSFRHPSRFGISPEEFPTAMKLAAIHGIAVNGLHFHQASNVNDPAPYEAILVRYRREIAELLNQGPAESLWLDVGGGFPGKSVAANGSLIPHSAFASRLHSVVKEMGVPPEVEIVIEPGRSLVEDQGVLVTRVVATKQKRGRTCLVTDGGLHLVRTLENWFHPIEILTQGITDETAVYDIHGYNCFEADVFGVDIPGARGAGVDDLVIVGAAGGYDITGAYPWIRPLPAIYGIRQGAFTEIRRAQTASEVRGLQSEEA